MGQGGATGKMTESHMTTTAVSPSPMSALSYINVDTGEGSAVSQTDSAYPSESAPTNPQAIS